MGFFGFVFLDLSLYFKCLSDTIYDSFYWVHKDRISSLAQVILRIFPFTNTDICLTFSAEVSYALHNSVITQSTYVYPESKFNFPHV